jgi:hypothetical protein
VSRRLGSIFESRDGGSPVVFRKEFEEAKEEREKYLQVVVVS